MGLSTNDIRYMAVCAKCFDKIGDWALKLPKEERLCWNCRPPKKIESLEYKETEVNHDNL